MIFFKHITNAQARNRGFTLVELLVVMAILGILATIGLGSFQSSQTKARDAQRKADLRQVGNALEAFYNDKGSYPLAANGQIQCQPASSCDWGETFNDENGTVYMVELPEDPRSSQEYVYVSDGSYWQLYARLENDLDPDHLQDEASGDLQNYGLNCGSAGSCTFGISSPNILPADGQSIQFENPS